MDAFDSDYDYLVLSDNEALELVGAYRLRRTGVSGTQAAQLFSNSLFEYRSAASRWEGLDCLQGFAELKAQLTAQDLSVPTLYKQDTELCTPGGVHFANFNVDPDFSDCVDGLVLVDLQQIEENKRRRYLGRGWLDKLIDILG